MFELIFRSYDVEEKLSQNSTENNGSKKGHDVSKVIKLIYDLHAYKAFYDYVVHNLFA